MPKLKWKLSKIVNGAVAFEDAALNDLSDSERTKFLARRARQAESMRRSRGREKSLATAAVHAGNAAQGSSAVIPPTGLDRGRNQAGSSWTQNSQTSVRAPMSSSQIVKFNTRDNYSPLPFIREPRGKTFVVPTLGETVRAEGKPTTGCEPGRGVKVEERDEVGVEVDQKGALLKSELIAVKIEGLCSRSACPEKAATSEWDPVKSPDEEEEEEEVCRLLI
ncbi:hypothetical protein BD779DRAFT_1671509 [Infundibulicybe gibba]|nr:hypothetical protein BD779DRAFT_1671509 [Infundibulicybe gibba]